MLSALRNARPTHLLDQGLWRALGLPVAREEEEGAPKAQIPAQRLVRD
jgi:hypothetical protein